MGFVPARGAAQPGRGMPEANLTVEPTGRLNGSVTRDSRPLVARRSRVAARLKHLTVEPTGDSTGA
jgi:hypothetical protein